MPLLSITALTSNIFLLRAMNAMLARVRSAQAARSVLQISALRLSLSQTVISMIRVIERKASQSNLGIALFCCQARRLRI